MLAMLLCHAGIGVYSQRAYRGSLVILLSSPVCFLLVRWDGAVDFHHHS